jgi:hypothetical protein
LRIKSSFQTPTELGEMQELLKFQEDIAKKIIMEESLQINQQQLLSQNNQFIERNAEMRQNMNLSIKGTLLFWHGLLSVAGFFIIILSIVGIFQDGMQNTPGVIFFFDIVFALIIFSFFKKLKKYKKLKKDDLNAETITPIQMETLIDNKVLETKEEKKKIEHQIVAMRSDYKKLYSDIIERHPEFLKLEYLLERYQI